MFMRQMVCLSDIFCFGSELLSLTFTIEKKKFIFTLK